MSTAKWPAYTRRVEDADGGHHFEKVFICHCYNRRGPDGGRCEICFGAIPGPKERGT